jgi:protein-S-isoprenylcysteine O-methyltransferase Ste14
MLNPIGPEFDREAGISRRLRTVPPQSISASEITHAARASGLSLTFLRDPGSLVAMFVMAFVFYNQVLRHGFPPSIPNTFAAALLCGAIALFAVRREPARKGNAFDAFLAIVGTFSMAFLPIARYHHISITVLQIVGSAIWLWALVSLGRSFGIAPADRGLKTRGPYRFVRHPMYAGELLNSLGAVIAVASAQGVIVFSIWWLFQMLRILKEEPVIAGYGEYRQVVRWRVLPGVW